MRIHEIWIRFYKSFNFDYELKATPGAKERSWQVTRDGWMPHVRIPIESDMTAVVGANESGKTHLLDAIRIVLTGDGLLKQDFCRSSSLFSVERDTRQYPEVGAIQEGLSPEMRRLRELEALGYEKRPQEFAWAEKLCYAAGSLEKESDSDTVRALRPSIEQDEPEWVRRIEDVWRGYWIVESVAYWSGVRYRQPSP